MLKYTEIQIVRVEKLQIVLIMGFSAFILATFFAQYACPDSVEPGEDDFPRPGELKTNKGSSDSNYREKAERDWRDHTEQETIPILKLRGFANAIWRNQVWTDGKGSLRATGGQRGN